MHHWFMGMDASDECHGVKKFNVPRSLDELYYVSDTTKVGGLLRNLPTYCTVFHRLGAAMRCISVCALVTVINMVTRCRAFLSPGVPANKKNLVL